MQLGSDTPAESYAVGERVRSEDSRGTVVAVGENTVDVKWDDGKDKYGAITYPVGATFLAKCMPWES